MRNKIRFYSRSGKLYLNNLPLSFFLYDGHQINISNIQNGR